MQRRIWSLGRLATCLASVTLATSAGLAAMTVFPAGEAAAEEESVPPERLYRVPESLADRLAGTVFTMTNGTDPALGNQIVAFHRLDDGTLSVAGFFPTEDLGSGPAPTSTVFGVPVPANADGLGSQGALLLSEPRDDGARRLFAVNAGGDLISCFRVEADDPADFEPADHGLIARAFPGQPGPADELGSGRALRAELGRERQRRRL